MEISTPSKYKVAKLLLQLFPLVLFVGHTSNSNSNLDHDEHNRRLQSSVLDVTSPSFTATTSSHALKEVEKVGNNGEPEDVYPLQECQGDWYVSKCMSIVLLCRERNSNQTVPFPIVATTTRTALRVSHALVEKEESPYLAALAEKT